MSLRIANAQGSTIFDANINIHLIQDTVNKEGMKLKKIIDLPLIRHHSPIFALSWNVFHMIDENSPFFEKSKEEIQKTLVYIIASVEGHEQIYGQNVYDRKIYRKEMFEWDCHFVDVISENAKGQTVLNLRSFHDTQPSIKKYWTQTSS